MSHRTRLPARVPFLICIWPCVAALAGCGGGPPAPVDAERARTALVDALEAWKEGHSAEELRQRRPAIHVTDVQWRNGTRLFAYRLVDDGRARGANLHCQVELTLADPGLYRLYRSIAMGLGGNTDYAKRNLVAQVEEDADADTAKMARAVSLLLGGDPDWRRWLDNVLATSSDQKARAAAHEVLNYLQGRKRLS